MTIFRGPGGTGSATSDSDTTEFQEFLVQSQAARDAALAAQAAAELAETNAETAETNAETAETNAETAATNAASSASAAASSASSASTSATNAASSASAASTSATNASASASAAAASASAALTSENNAETAETNAAASASAAASSASTATTQASNAAASASAALASETAAASSASSASSSASAASISASNAATSASNAASSATSAANSASAAAASAASINPADIVHISGTETITGAKTFSQTITGSITGNAGTVTNGVYTTGDQTIAGTKTFSSNPVLSAGTANGVAYLNGSKVLTTGSALTFDGTNLGIGTSSPGYKLDVRGNVAGGNGTIATGLSWDTNGLVGTFTNHSLGIMTNSSVVARFDTSGNLGLGVTPSAWAANSSAIQNKAGGMWAFGTGTVNVGTNTLWDGSNYRYITTDYASFMNLGAGGVKWFTAPTGTAGNAISFTQAMTLDASGNLLVGTTSPLINSGGRGNITINGSTDAVLAFGNGGSAAGYIFNNASNLIVNAQGARAITFENNGAERARINSSGQLLINRTGGLSGLISGQIGSGALDIGISLQAASAGNWGLAFFNSGGSNIGQIVLNSSSTSYNTTSDYRLKENVQPMAGALAKVAALKPVTYTWKATGEADEGFIAHELAEVCPSAVTGEKDAVDAEGNPVYQGIDTSFLVATLTAAIQEQQQLITALTARVAALESN